jgi:L-seryl-tRNA(Ser) seleniumtransferase
MSPDENKFSVANIPQRVINATGVFVHTNLGRSPLSPASLQAIAEYAGGYYNLELEVGSGKRGHRDMQVEGLLRRLTGGESALVVNNNAAALLLTLSTLAKGREVIVSRGELIEIGGSFRLPEVMSASGAELVAVGSLNHTTLEDYRRAFGERTAGILVCHRSNFYLQGWDERPTLAELSALAKEQAIPLLFDLGSGAIVPEQALGEMTIGQAVAGGADLVMASGDKLMGGPQAGIIVGRAELIERLRRNHLLRALRPDKLTYLALWGLLQAIAEGRASELPLVKALRRKPGELKRCASRLRGKLTERLGDGYRLSVVPTKAMVGGGTLPQLELPSYAVLIQHRSKTPQELAEEFRRHKPAILGRILKEGFALDVFAMLEGEEKFYKD